MSTADDYRSSYRDPATGWIGWIIFAAVFMIVSGGMNAIQGLAALFRDEAYWVTLQGAVVTFGEQGFADLSGLLGYVERLKGSAKLRPDSKLVVSRDWPSGEQRLNGALQISRGLMKIALAAEAANAKALEPA